MQQKSTSLSDGSPSAEGTSGRAYLSDFSLHPNTDSASDNETGERPVREKLKKASIASMPRDSLAYSVAEDAASDDNVVGHVNAFTKPDHTLSLSKHVDHSRGRAERKRSLQDLGMGRNYMSFNSEKEEGSGCSPIRKKSMDVPNNTFQEDNCAKATRKASGPEHDERRTEYDADTGSSKIHITRNGTDILSLPQMDSDDFEITHSIFGPRKKRSRDQLDTEIDREQKIVATEEAKAQRRSEEHERDDLETTIITDADIERRAGSAGSKSGEGGPQRFSSFATQEVSIYRSIGFGVHPLTQLQISIPSNDLFMSSVSPVLTIPQPTVPAPPSAPSKVRDSPLTHSSTTTRPSSGFAALSGASGSPFSTIGSPSKTSKLRPFEAPADDAKRRGQLEKPIMPTEEATLNATKPSSPLGLGTSGSSAVNLLGPSSFSSLGSGVFGTGFGQAFNGGTKLGSFAAPVGDAKWGDQGGSTNLFGAPAKDEENDNSGSEEHGLVEIDNNDEGYEVDCRFQQQDGKFRPDISMLNC